MESTNYVRLLRVTTYGVTACLGLLILVAALPPLFSASSTRAVVNAPVLAVTAPIDGTVESFVAHEGDHLIRGDTVATLRNVRVERNTLTQLEIRLAEIAGSRERARRAATLLTEKVRELDDALVAKRTTQMGLLTARIEEAEARQRAADANVALGEVRLKRQEMLVKKDVVAATKSAEERSLLEAAREEAAAQAAAVSVSRTLFAAAALNIYVSDGLADLANLENELRARTLELEEAERTYRSASTQYDRLATLAAAERRRIRDRTKSVVAVPQDARLMTKFVATGQSVSPGATLAHAIDCRAQRVVAIFPQRYADMLEPGRKVSLHADTWDQPRNGFVDRVLPRANTSLNQLYAVPFPPIERRELYAIVAFTDVQRAAADCDVGRWVEVRVGAGIVPQTLRKVQTAVRRTGRSFAAHAAPTDGAEAHAPEARPILATHNGTPSTARAGATSAAALAAALPAGF